MSLSQALNQFAQNLGRYLDQRCLQQTHTHNQRGRSGQAGDKIHRGIRLRIGSCEAEKYYTGKDGGVCLNNL